MRGTGGAVGGLGMDGWAGAIGGNTTLVLMVPRTEVDPLMTVLVPPNVGRARPGGACNKTKYNKCHSIFKSTFRLHLTNRT